VLVMVALVVLLVLIILLLDVIRVSVSPVVVRTYSWDTLRDLVIRLVAVILP